MREIKFRYRVSTKVEVGDFIPVLLESDGFKMFSLKDIERGVLKKWCKQMKAIIKARDVFTGLHDKNGKEIYEGDIIYEGYSKRSFRKWTFEDWTGAEEWGIIEYRNGMFVINYYSIYGGEGYGRLDERVRQMKRFRVIGNIYENPELLKGA